jgi:hypothetical protein
MFGCSYLGDGNSSNNVQSVTGQTGTFVQAMNYDYMYGQGPDSYVDLIGANGGTILYRSQDNNGRAIFYNGAGGNYRAIHSSVIFGALRDGAHTKTELMTEYMDYLTELIGIEEFTKASILNLMLSPNPTRGGTVVSFGLTEPGRLNIVIYNSAGQYIRKLIDAELSQGDHSIVWDTRDDRGRELSSGTYILRTELNGQVTPKVIVLLK